MANEMENWKKTPKWQRKHPLLNTQPQQHRVAVYQESHVRPERTKEERAEIMRRNLPNLYAAIGIKPKQPQQMGDLGGGQQTGHDLVEHYEGEF